MQTTNNIRRTVVITGSNKGLGYNAIDQLLRESTSYDIILTARNTKLGQEAFDTLSKKYSSTSSKLTFHQLDITDPKSIDNFIQWIKTERNGKIDILVNNAGVYAQENRLEMLNINFLSTIEFTEKMLPYLASDGRIITVSSILGLLSYLSEENAKILDDPTLTRERLIEFVNQLVEKAKVEADWSDISYNLTKALVNAHTRWVLVKMLREDQQAYTMHPGWCQTDMGGKNAPQSVEEGSDNIVNLINYPFGYDEKNNGKFFNERTVHSF
jgi:NAD(P)-dependent dehydrogenase (short-subunit alcohol dehydrogenase family)